MLVVNMVAARIRFPLGSRGISHRFECTVRVNNCYGLENGAERGCAHVCSRWFAYARELSRCRPSGERGEEWEAGLGPVKDPRTRVQAPLWEELGEIFHWGNFPWGRWGMEEG